jgi:hypothetical protein
MRRALLLSLVLALPAVPARADPIIFITSGSLDLSHGGAFGGLGTMELRGTRGFRLSAFAESGGFGFSCLPCNPGTPLDLGGPFAELGGPAMLNGHQFQVPSVLADISLWFAGATVPAPPLSAQAVLSTPFMLVAARSPRLIR